MFLIIEQVRELNTVKNMDINFVDNCPIIIRMEIWQQRCFSFIWELERAPFEKATVLPVASLFFSPVPFTLFCVSAAIVGIGSFLLQCASLHNFNLDPHKCHVQGSSKKKAPQVEFVDVPFWQIDCAWTGQFARQQVRR